MQQENAVGESDSSSQILIKYVGNLPTIKLSISDVLFLEFFAHRMDGYNNNTSSKKL